MDKCNYKEAQSVDSPKNTCGLNLVEITKSAKDSIIQTRSPEGGLGSGFIISNGKEHLVVTAEHNLDQNNDTLKISHKGKTYDSVVVQRDNETDVAVMRLGTNLSTAPKHALKPYVKDMQPNESVVTIGHPGGVKKAQVSPGFVRGRDDAYPDLQVITATQPCNFGNSGGVQLRKDGSWWGIQQAIGPRYECTSLGAKDVVRVIQRVPGWENYGK